MENICGTYEIYELGEPQSQLHKDGMCVIGDRPDEPVVVGQEIVVEPLGVGVRCHGDCTEGQDEGGCRLEHDSDDASLRLLAFRRPAGLKIVCDGSRQGRGSTGAGLALLGLGEESAGSGRDLRRPQRPSNTAPYDTIHKRTSQLLGPQFEYEPKGSFKKMYALIYF